ncbi:hypothetical protein BLNAU_17465 [Blattamonas nauphoetae]|uniref:Uncharacterized protein n=1 Tax=Blattamonas nauphoetae TaxID=2049346 RepID=A0ABQ9X7C3_9EUKA|nr:hypothetical protein BLNAU_17465 [Blattamonas nauphoetae]
MSVPIRSSASKFAFNHHNSKDTQHTHLFCAGRGNRDPPPLYSPPTVSIPTTIPFLPSISIDFANFCSTNIDTSPASALPLSSIASCPITLLDEYPSLSSFLHIHSTIILFSLLHTLVPFHQSIISKAGPFTSVTERLVASIGLHTLYPLLQAMTLLRHLILFSPPHTVKQLQDRAFRCGLMGWLHFGACSPPVAITQPRSQEKEDTSWMSMSIAAESNARPVLPPFVARLDRTLPYPLLLQSLYNSALVPAPLHPAHTHCTRFFTPLDTKDKQSEPLRLQPSSIAHPLLTSPQYHFVNRHTCAMPPSFHLLHPINLADIHLSPFYEPAHATSTSLTWHEPNYLLSPFILPPSSFWAMSSPDFFYHNMSPSANSNPHTRHTNGWDTFDQWNISDKKLRQRESYTTLVSFSAQEIQRHIALKLKLLVKDFQAKTKTSPRTTSENIDSWSESPSEQTKDDPQHTTQHPLPNPFRVHSDDTVKRTTVDADGSGRDLGDPLSLADWDRALSQAKEDGLDVKEGEKMSKLHHFEHTTTTFLHTLIRDRIQSELNLKDALSKQGKSTAKHSMTSSKPQITDYFTEAHSKDFENTQILTVAVKRGHSLLSPVGRMVKEATLTNSAFWAMFDSDTRSPVLVWGEKDRQELVSFLHNEMEDNAKLTATTNKPTDAAMKEDATVGQVGDGGWEARLRVSFVDARPVARQSEQGQTIVHFSVVGVEGVQPVQSSNDKSHPALVTTQGTITNTLLHPPLVIFPPAPTLSHLRLVFTSSLSHVKAGEYFIDVLMEEYAPVLFLVHQHSVENVAQLLASDERRKAGGSQTITYSAERPPALYAEQQEATSATQHIDTMRGIDDCSQFARSLFAVSNPLLFAEELMKRIECLGQVLGNLEQGLAKSFDIQNSKTSSLLFAALPDLSVLHLLLRFCVALSRPYPQTSPSLSVIILSSIVCQSVSLIHTIQRTAAGRKSSEQFAEHGEFELLTLIHSSKARLLSFKDKNGIALVFSFFNVAPFLSTLYPISSTVQPDDSLLARSAPRQKTQSSVPLVSFSRIESTLSHPISFPKTHRVIVSLDSLIPLFASNQIFPLSIGPRSFLYQNQISRYNRSATTKDNFDVLNHLFKVFLHDMSPLSLAFLPFAPTKATLTRIAKLYISASSPDAREAVKMEMSVMIKRMSQYAERKHAREEKWNELASFHSQDRHSRQSGCAVCTAIIQLGKEESADFEATRASLYLHLNTAIKLSRDRPTASATYRADERVSSFILSSHDNTLDLHGNQITHTKEETTENATDEELDTPSPSSAMDDRKSESPHLKQTHTLPPSVSTQATTPPAPSTPRTFPRLASRPVSQRALDISSPSLPRGQSSLASSSSFTLQDTPTPFSDSVPSEAEEGQATDLTTQLQDDEDDENFDAMDEFRQFSLQKSFGGRGSEWGGASNGGRGGHLTNLFACFPLSIPPHADAQKTNDMAFPPSTRLKMHKERSTLFLLQYVCMITDLPLKDDMVTFDDTTRSGSVSPYFEALHIISRCLLTQSPVARLFIPSSRQLVFRSIR